MMETQNNCYAYKRKDGKINRFGNLPTVVDGHRFDSKKEANRYLILKQRQADGLISKLELQPKFVLVEAFEDAYGEQHRPITYRADFKYIDANGQTVVEDVKSPATKTALYELKKKILLRDFRWFLFKEVMDINV